MKYKCIMHCLMEPVHTFISTYILYLQLRQINNTWYDRRKRLEKPWTVLCRHILSITTSQRLTNTKIKLEKLNFMFSDVANHFCCLNCLSCLSISCCFISIGGGSADVANDVNYVQANCHDGSSDHQIIKQYVFVLFWFLFWCKDFAIILFWFLCWFFISCQQKEIASRFLSTFIISTLLVNEIIDHDWKQVRILWTYTWIIDDNINVIC